MIEKIKKNIGIIILVLGIGLYYIYSKQNENKCGISEKEFYASNPKSELCKYYGIDHLVGMEYRPEEKELMIEFADEYYTDGSISNRAYKHYMEYGVLYSFDAEIDDLDECTLERISKDHFRFTVNEDTVYIIDSDQDSGVGMYKEEEAVTK